MPEGSIRQIATGWLLPAPGRSRPAPRVPWDWTDVVLFFGALLLGLSLLSALFSDASVQSFGRTLVHGLSAQEQTALGNFVEQTAVYALAMIIVAVLVMGRRQARLSDLGWRMPRLRWLPVAVVASAVSLVVLTWLLNVEAGIVHVQNAQIATVQSEYGHQYAIAIVLLSVEVPLAEETFFRGFVYGWMRRQLNVPAAAVLSGCFFAAAHAGWGTSSEEILFLPLALLGILLALLYEYSRSLLPGAIVHGIFNLVGTLQIL
jgi:membrane protease YdiL (CAAX protease family)